MNEVTISFCPRCQTQLIRARWSGDFVHQCTGADSLKNEDILVIGDWVDFTGSDSNVSPSVLSMPQPNKLHGTRAHIEGNKSAGGRTPRGFPKSRYRTRQFLQYLDSDFFKVQEEKDQIDPEQFTGDS